MSIVMWVIQIAIPGWASTTVRFDAAACLTDFYNKEQTEQSELGNEAKTKRKDINLSKCNKITAKSARNTFVWNLDEFTWQGQPFLSFPKN